ncbi:MAG: DUF899 domain-containing protein [Betaproteobacteria bacterium]|jgi:predicted dithiol-disulfide oxidoreductase (DUF899 family)|nr:DUF899 domain-containing protein [Betaproteobacteria bacterium]
MPQHRVVSHEEWVAARREHLAREKEFTRQRDELSRARRELPWEKIDKEYVFDTSAGRKTLADLFDGRSQLIVYHFMYGPDWSDGCKSCSFWADNFDGVIVHLKHRDVTMIAVSRAPLETLMAYRKRMGWRFEWASSYGNDFNRDFGVTFTPEEMAKGEMVYNYRVTKFPSDEAPGISVFYRSGDGEVFHTYSCYERGLDMLNGAYHYLDLVPKGRDESDLPYTMAWLRHHDKYAD